ncbi:MAG: lipoate-protein ligase B/lipoate synthase [Deltaproteobacteria bacterium]|nr:lipoate-protein ligase B/lipoate synthase [Deltaproteobacteria bacterium]
MRIPALADQGERKSVIYRLGLVEYGKAYRMQRTLHQKRVNGEIEDILILLEHPPTLTIGKSGSEHNILVPGKVLHSEGISLFFIERGGDVTYHGPGQIVGYPIIDLKGRGRDVRAFVRDLEEVLISTVRDFGIDAKRDESHPGVWVENCELAAIGLSIRKWVSMHGFALNVHTDLNHFKLINPCGFSDRTAASMSEVLGLTVAIESVIERLAVHFSRIFAPAGVAYLDFPCEGGL